MQKKLKALYQSKIDQKEIVFDPLQQEAINALCFLQEKIEHKKAKPSLFSRFLKEKIDAGEQGLYLYGGVGRGKSMLMDMFYETLDIEKKRRIHFHEFMVETHDYMHKRRMDAGDKGVEKILPDYAKEIAASVKVLCFDEFHIRDIADAMILGRLFQALFDEGLYIITTSNVAPDGLYKDGLQRERFLPFIDLIKHHLITLFLDSPTDHRKTVLLQTETYFYPLSSKTDKALDTLFLDLAEHDELTPIKISVKGREIPILGTKDGVGRADFISLCEKPLGAEDYIKIADKFHTLFIEHIPKMNYDRRNEAKRFILLIDALYEAKTKVIFSADAPIDKLYRGDDHKFEFDRTISRIHEMQSDQYLNK